MIGAYIRVSSRQQSFESQKDAIFRAARARGDEIGCVFAEKLSGAGRGPKERPALTELLASVRRGELSKVYVFRIDRLSRAGIRDVLAIVDDLRGHGCQLATVADGFDVEGPAGPVVLAVMAWAAQMERDALGERISAARARVEAAGGNWGRPRRIDPGALAQALALRAQGRTIREVSAALRIPRSTLQGALAENGHYAPKPKGGAKSFVARRN